jgi:hypothetical protein
MFNYYCRIAALAKEYEIDGKIEKSIKLKEILKNQNRCKSCGIGLSENNGLNNCENYVCYECSISLEM